MQVRCGTVAVSAKTFEEALTGSMPRLAALPEPFTILDEDGAPSGHEPDLTDQQLTELYRWMLWGRQLDERGLQLQRQGRVGIWGPMIGQEAAQAGLGLALQPGD